MEGTDDAVKDGSRVKASERKSSHWIYGREERGCGERTGLKKVKEKEKRGGQTDGKLLGCGRVDG